MPAADPQQPKEPSEFLWKVHGYTNEYIRFADQKAALALAAESGIIAALYAAKLHQACSPQRLNWEHASVSVTLTGVGATLAFGLLLAAAVAAVGAVIPRLWHEFTTSFMTRVKGKLTKETPKGSIFWREVVQHKTREDYADYVLGLDAKHRDLAVAHHIHALAGVADRKYRWVNASLILGPIGAVLAILLLLFT